MTVAPGSTVPRYSGKTASGGVARGKMFFLNEDSFSDIVAPAGPESERERLEHALQRAVQDLTAILEALDDDEAEGMLEFQLAMIEDDAVRDPAFERIAGGKSALEGWLSFMAEEIADYESSDDEYFRGRAIDLKDIRDRVGHYLAGGGAVEIPAGCILVGSDLSPSRFLDADWGDGGVALLRGSISSHVAMLARARSVPMIVGMDRMPQPVDGEVYLNADSGELIVSADEEERRALCARMVGDRQRRKTEAAYRGRAAVTPDGEKIRVLINISDPAELDGIDPGSCDGVGLVRTEFLFHGVDTLPDEDEQFAVYQRIVEWARGKPVTIRTLDAGGDKLVAGLTEPGESNPFLGLRGIRMSLSHPEIFRAQLRALLRAAASGPLKIMIPMITVPEEMVQVRGILCEEKARLDRSGCARGEPLLGMMVEVPAAAIAIEEFDAEFFSIGSNDLIQYVTACSRDASRLDHLYRADNLAVLRLIGNVAAHGAARGLEVSVCGEMAGEEAHIGRLIRIGVRTLSVPPSLLGRTKFVLAHLDDPEDG